jgi:hypothetical protein
MPCEFEDFGAKVREPQVVCRSLEQADVKLIFEFGDTAAHRGNRHLEPLCGLRKTARLDNLRKYQQGIQVFHHRFAPFDRRLAAICGNALLRLPLQRASQVPPQAYKRDRSRDFSIYGNPISGLSVNGQACGCLPSRKMWRMKG